MVVSIDKLEIPTHIQVINYASEFLIIIREKKKKKRRVVLFVYIVETHSQLMVNKYLNEPPKTSFNYEYK